MNAGYTSKWTLMLGLAVLLAAGCGRGEDASKSVAFALMSTGRPECPITDDSIEVDSTFYQTFSLSGAITHVPEFHDCQRFVLMNGDTATYGGMFAVFASFQLDSLADTIGFSRGEPTAPPAQPPTPPPAVPPQGPAVVDSSRLPNPRTTVTIPPAAITSISTYAPTRSRSRALSFVEIVAFDSNYAQLGILKGFNCLYLNRNGPLWEATMVAVTEETVCPIPLHLVPDGKIRSRTTLQVTPETPHSTQADLTGGDVPSVARWDYDFETKEQIVGVRCGNQWCNVGRRSHPSLRPLPTIPAFEPVGSHPRLMADETRNERYRVIAARGWFDFQQLANQTSAGSWPTPSSTYGWLIPNPVLHRINDPEVFGTWINTATAYVTADYNNGSVTLTRGANRIWLCKDGAPRRQNNCEGASSAPALKGACPSTEIWYARFDTGNGRVFRRVCRRGHEGSTPPITIPGTARWRWLAGDETEWKRCMTGCCEIQ